MEPRTDKLKEIYKLEAHPEGGWFSEVYTAPFEKDGRALAGSIYFLLDAGEQSQFHQIDCEELWFYHEGCGVRITVLQDGRIEELLLGPDCEHGQRMLAAIPKDAIFSAENLTPDGYTFVSCVTTPKFRYEGFRLVGERELGETYPDYAGKKLDFSASIRIKPMETDDEKHGKAYVHWRAWHEAYPGMVSQRFLDGMTLEKCTDWAFRFSEGTWVAKDGDRVVGFLCIGDRGEEAPGVGEIFALYVLSEYYGTGVAQKLMRVGLEQLAGYPTQCLWVLKENRRAIRFYEKCGFRFDGTEEVSPRTEAVDCRMVRKHGG